MRSKPSGGQRGKLLYLPTLRRSEYDGLLILFVNEKKKQNIALVVRRPIDTSAVGRNTTENVRVQFVTIFLSVSYKLRFKSGRARAVRSNSTLPVYKKKKTRLSM